MLSFLKCLNRYSNKGFLARKIKKELLKSNILSGFTPIKKAHVSTRERHVVLMLKEFVLFLTDWTLSTVSCIEAIEKPSSIIHRGAHTM